MILATTTVGTIVITIIAFLILVMALVALLLFTKEKLAPSGPVTITINGEKQIEVPAFSVSAMSLPEAGRPFPRRPPTFPNGSSMKEPGWPARSK